MRGLDLSTIEAQTKRAPWIDSRDVVALIARVRELEADVADVAGDEDVQRRRGDILAAALREALGGWADAEQHRPAARLHPEGPAAIERLRALLGGG